MTIERKLTGPKPRTTLPKGTVDTQMHMYLPGYPSIEGGPPNPPGDLPTPDQYRQVMEWLGIDRVVVTQGNAQQKDHGNLLACLAEMGDVARGIGCIDADTSEAELDQLAEAGVVGARIMDLPGGAVPLSKLDEVAPRAKARDWVMTVQFDGSRIEEEEARLARLDQPWILDHHAKIFDGPTPGRKAAIKRLLDGGNCWFKFAGCYESSTAGAPDFDDVAEVAREMAAHAPERIVWGTNWPHNMAKTTSEYPDDAALLNTVLSWFPSEDAMRMALVDTPQSLFFGGR
ncbi:D-galactarolactone isomerase [Palleronia marisminoris]|uniref:4-sulfomuconolactone hydrolase n=1 Tax=Palleronia marisminoris TaxID=315423 RepID=A0A1Y5TN04_9RHOB|nr:amidohydrolase family protein [Palleronia marisminoris]SFH41924.1 D-galactarolactone isomerase [Palleronia marisminoris]SLN65757.1 4-sulfomuconolactone hydrolase [Palleronia marisminoris]